MSQLTICPYSGGQDRNPPTAKSRTSEALSLRSVRPKGPPGQSDRPKRDYCSSVSPILAQHIVLSDKGTSEPHHAPHHVFWARQRGPPSPAFDTSSVAVSAAGVAPKSWRSCHGTTEAITGGSTGRHPESCRHRVRDSPQTGFAGAALAGYLVAHRPPATW